MLFQLNQFKSLLVCVCFFDTNTVVKNHLKERTKQKQNKNLLKQICIYYPILTKIFVYISLPFFFLSTKNFSYFLPNYSLDNKNNNNTNPLIEFWTKKMLPWTMLDKTNQPNRNRNRKTNQPKTKLQSHHNNNTQKYTHEYTHR